MLCATALEQQALVECAQGMQMPAGTNGMAPFIAGLGVLTGSGVVSDQVMASVLKNKLLCVGTCHRTIVKLNALCKVIFILTCI